MKEIITDLSLLERPAEPLKFVTDDGIKKEEGLQIVTWLKETLEATPGLTALAAPQIGVNKRIFCIKFDDAIKTFINPVITKKSGSQIAPETFGSLPGHEILLARPTEITVVYHTEDFKYEENKLLGPAARIFDQQAQLLDGVLPTELGLVSNVEEDGSLGDLTEDEIAQLVEVYKKFVAAKAKAMAKAAESNEAIANQYKQLKFTESVINGRTQVVANDPAPPKMNRAQRRAVNKVKRTVKR